MEASQTRVEQLALTALMLLPGALIVYTGFNAGATSLTPAVVVLVLTQVLLVRIIQARRP